MTGSTSPRATPNAPRQVEDPGALEATSPPTRQREDGLGRREAAARHLPERRKHERDEAEIRHKSGVGDGKVGNEAREVCGRSDKKAAAAAARSHPLFRSNTPRHREAELGDLEWSIQLYINKLTYELLNILHGYPLAANNRSKLWQL